MALWRISGKASIGNAFVALQQQDMCVQWQDLQEHTL